MVQTRDRVYNIIRQEQRLRIDRHSRRDKKAK